MQRKLKAEIEKEQEKRRQLEQEVKVLKNTNKKLTKQIIPGNSTGHGPSPRAWKVIADNNNSIKRKLWQLEFKLH